METWIYQQSILYQSSFLEEFSRLESNIQQISFCIEKFHTHKSIIKVRSVPKLKYENLKEASQAAFLFKK